MMHLPDDASDQEAGIIKVIGLGQSLRGDDAAGLEAVRQWLETCQSRHGIPNVQVELAELPGISLLNLLEGSRFAILVDAVHSGASPGTVHVLDESQLSAFAQDSTSAHGWGVAETLALGRQLESPGLPDQLVVIGIEAGQLNLGADLSPEVKSALAKVTRLIEQTVIRASRNS